MSLNYKHVDFGVKTPNVTSSRRNIGFFSLTPKQLQIQLNNTQKPRVKPPQTQKIPKDFKTRMITEFQELKNQRLNSQNNDVVIQQLEPQNSLMCLTIVSEEDTVVVNPTTETLDTQKSRKILDFSRIRESSKLKRNQQWNNTIVKKTKKVQNSLETPVCNLKQFMVGDLITSLNPNSQNFRLRKNHQEQEEIILKSEIEKTLKQQKEALAKSNEFYFEQVISKPEILIEKQEKQTVFQQSTKKIQNFDETLKLKDQASGENDSAIAASAETTPMGPKIRPIVRKSTYYLDDSLKKGYLQISPKSILKIDVSKKQQIQKEINIDLKNLDLKSITLSQDIVSRTHDSIVEKRETDFSRDEECSPIVPIRVIETSPIVPVVETKKQVQFKPPSQSLKMRKDFWKNGRPVANTNKRLTFSPKLAESSGRCSPDDEQVLIYVNRPCQRAKQQSICPTLQGSNQESKKSIFEHFLSPVITESKRDLNDFQTEIRKLTNSQIKKIDQATNINFGYEQKSENYDNSHGESQYLNAKNNQEFRAKTPGETGFRLKSFSQFSQIGRAKIYKRRNQYCYQSIENKDIAEQINFKKLHESIISDKIIKSEKNKNRSRQQAMQSQSNTQYISIISQLSKSFNQKPQKSKLKIRDTKTDIFEHFQKSPVFNQSPIFKIKQVPPPVPPPEPPLRVQKSTGFVPVQRLAKRDTSGVETKYNSIMERDGFQHFQVQTDLSPEEISECESPVSKPISPQPDQFEEATFKIGVNETQNLEQPSEVMQEESFKSIENPLKQYSIIERSSLKQLSIENPLKVFLYDPEDLPVLLEQKDETEVNSANRVGRDTTDDIEESYLNDSPFVLDRKKTRGLIPRATLPNFNIQLRSTPHKVQGESRLVPQKSRSNIIMIRRQKVETIPHKKKVFKTQGIVGKNVFRTIENNQTELTIEQFLNKESI